MRADHSSFGPLLFFFAVLLPQAASLSLPSNPSSTHDENWATAVRKGTVLYEQLQSGRFPDRETPVTVADLLAGRWELTGWPPQAEPVSVFSPGLARLLGWTMGLNQEDYYTIDAGRAGMYCYTLFKRFFLLSSVLNYSRYCELLLLDLITET